MACMASRCLAIGRLVVYQPFESTILGLCSRILAGRAWLFLIFYSESEFQISSNSQTMLLTETFCLKDLPILVVSFVLSLI